MQLLREHFPWGQDGCPPRPADDDEAIVAESALAWIQNQVDMSGLENAALALHARVQGVLEELRGNLPATEGSRFFYRSDLSHLMKSPESILDRMARDWDPAAGEAPRIGFNDIVATIEDLARFRIVLNFLSDVKLLCQKIEEPYRLNADDRLRLTQAQQALYVDFRLRDNRLEDLIMLHPAKRLSGERCRKGLFFLRTNGHVRIEVQIQTMLQEAWDKKDHFLVYEHKRRGEDVDQSHSIESYAMSELLYVADLTFDRLFEIVCTPKREE
jgi:ppGpp synthetase/RelA/SpoT-type nucleotidyltranferase